MTQIGEVASPIIIESYEKDNVLILNVTARGWVGSSGWTNPRLEPRYYAGGKPSDNKIRLDFVADSPPPGSQVLWLIAPITANIILTGLTHDITHICIHSANNEVCESIGTYTKLTK